MMKQTTVLQRHGLVHVKLLGMDFKGWISSQMPSASYRVGSFSGQGTPQGVQGKKAWEPDHGKYGWWKKSCTSWQVVLSYYWKGFIHPRWCRILSINRIIFVDLGTLVKKSIFEKSTVVARIWDSSLGKYVISGWFHHLRDHPDEKSLNKKRGDGGENDTVDGHNPAPPRMMIIPLFIGF